MCTGTVFSVCAKIEKYVLFVQSIPVLLKLLLFIFLLLARYVPNVA